MVALSRCIHWQQLIIADMQSIVSRKRGLATLLWRKGGERMLLGERLKETRQSKGVSQSTVAEHLNISRQSISKWENNSSYPDLDNLVRLSEYYEISIDDLL